MRLRVCMRIVPYSVMFMYRPFGMRLLAGFYGLVYTLKSRSWTGDEGAVVL